MLISAPSMRVCRSALEVSAPRSFPARSTKENLPCTLPLVRRRIWKQAWEREELELANVCPEVLWQRRTKKGYELLVGGAVGGGYQPPWHLRLQCSQFSRRKTVLRHPVPLLSFLPWAAALPPAIWAWLTLAAKVLNSVSGPWPDPGP